MLRAAKGVKDADGLPRRGVHRSRSSKERVSRNWMGVARGSPALVLALAFGASACGGRTASTLATGGSSSGGSPSGGSPSGGSNFGGGGAGTGAVGGTGGSVQTGGTSATAGCLQQVPPIVQATDGTSPYPDRHPHLVRSSNDGQQMTVAFSRASPDVVSLRHATFHPWTQWPSSGVVAPVYDSFSGVDISTDFRAGASSDGHFALLVRHEDTGGGFLRFAAELDSNASGLAPDVALDGSTPLFAAVGSAPWGGPEGEPWSLVGTTQAGTILAYPIQLLGLGGVPIPLGCANSAIVADAVRYQQGWLVALSNAGNAPDVGCAGVDPGPPTRIDFVFLAAFGPPSYLASFDAGAPLDSLVVAAHPLGLYVVYRVASGGAIEPVRWLRFDAPTQQIVGTGDVSGPTDAPKPAFAATSLGSDLAVVWGNDPADNPPDVVVSILDENGGAKASATLADHFHSSVSILGAQNGQSLVIAWDETNPATQASTTTLARFDCTQ